MSTHNSRFQIYIVVVVGSLLSFWLFQYMDEVSRHEVELQFVSNANERLLLIEKNIESELTVLRSVGGFFDASDVVHREEFSIFVSSLSEGREGSGFQAMEWIPRITLDKRRSYENVARNDGVVDFRITEKSKEGDLVTAKQRQEYFPVFYLEPYEGNEDALGFDLASNSARKAALEKARDTGKLVTSNRVNLVQLKDDQAGVLIFHPIYSKDGPHDSVEQRRQSVKGLVLGVMKLKSLISGVYIASNRKIIKPAGIDIYVYEENVSGQYSPLYIHNSRARANKAPGLSFKDARSDGYLESVIRVGDRKWSLIARPVKVGFGYVTLIQNWALLFSGLILTVLLAVYLFTLSSRAHIVTKRIQAEESLAKYREHLEELVKKRTQELQDTQDELVRKERLATLGQLTATVSHELRNPLAAMRPSLYFIRKKVGLEDDRLTQAIERLDRNVSRCDHIIDELLDFTRITDMELETVVLDDWLMGVLSEQTIHPDICFIQTLSLGDCTIEIDVNRLRRAVTNVIDNACHAMQEENDPGRVRSGSRLTIETVRQGDWIEICIQDTGIGIPEDVLPKIFEPLYSTKGFGVGLGMPIIKQILEQHGGRAEVASEQGKGTQITLWLPLAG